MLLKLAHAFVQILCVKKLIYSVILEKSSFLLFIYTEIIVVSIPFPKWYRYQKKAAKLIQELTASSNEVS